MTAESDYIVVTKSESDVAPRNPTRLDMLNVIEVKKVIDEAKAARKGTDKSCFASLVYVNPHTVANKKLRTFKAVSFAEKVKNFKVKDENGNVIGTEPKVCIEAVTDKSSKTEARFPKGVVKTSDYTRIVIGTAQNYEKKMQNATGDSTFKSGSLAACLSWVPGYENFLLQKTDELGNVVGYKLRVYAQTRNGEACLPKVSFYDPAACVPISRDEVKYYLANYKEDKNGNEIKDDKAVTLWDVDLDKIESLKFCGVEL